MNNSVMQNAVTQFNDSRDVSKNVNFLIFQKCSKKQQLSLKFICFKTVSHFIL